MDTGQACLQPWISRLPVAGLSQAMIIMLSFLAETSQSPVIQKKQ